MSIPNHTSKEQLTMKNPDTILADAIIAEAITTITNRLMDSNEFVYACHGRMIECNGVLSNALMEVNEALCGIRASIAEKDVETFNTTILALSSAVMLWIEKVNIIDREVREDFLKSKALKDEVFAKFEGLI
jgi:hypothetical protein